MDLILSNVCDVVIVGASELCLKESYTEKLLLAGVQQRVEGMLYICDDTFVQISL